MKKEGKEGKTSHSEFFLDVQERKSLQEAMRPFDQVRVHVCARLKNGERVLAGPFRGRHVRSCVDIETSKGMVYGEILLLFSSADLPKALVRTFKTSHSRRNDNLSSTKLQALERTGRFRVFRLNQIKIHVHIVPDFSCQDPEAFLLNPYVSK